MKNRIGLFILFAAILSAAFLVFRTTGKAPGGAGPVTIRGLIGGEKLEFVRDPEIVQLLKREHGITLDMNKRGSIEMITDPKAAEMDVLWPSNEVGIELYRETGQPMVASEIVFNSAICIYSWKSMVDVLVSKQVVERDAQGIARVNMEKLIALVEARQDWKSLGLNRSFGKVTVFSTDPTKSNSGNMYAGLLANILNGGSAPTDDEATKILPRLKRMFEVQGFMESSSDNIFQNYLSSGAGGRALVIGYESQLLGAMALYPQKVSRVREPIEILYPVPTVWASHPVIARTEAGKRLIEALRNPKIQKIAWERHGFRPASGIIDSQSTRPKGIPAEIDQVMPLPSARIMSRLLRELSTL